MGESWPYLTAALTRSKIWTQIHIEGKCCKENSREKRIICWPNTGPGIDSSLTTHKKNQLCWYLDFELLTSRTMTVTFRSKTYISNDVFQGITKKPNDDNSLGMRLWNSSSLALWTSLPGIWAVICQGYQWTREEGMRLRKAKCHRAHYYQY